MAPLYCHLALCSSFDPALLQPAQSHANIVHALPSRKLHHMCTSTLRSIWPVQSGGQSRCRHMASARVVAWYDKSQGSKFWATLAEHVWHMQVMQQDGSVRPLTPELKAKATQMVNHMAERALRCLAFAQKTDQLGRPLCRCLCKSRCHLSVFVCYGVNAENSCLESLSDCTLPCFLLIHSH